MCVSHIVLSVWYIFLIETKTKARFRRRTSHEPNRMLIRENKGFLSFAFDSAHVKCDVWTWPKEKTENESVKLYGDKDTDTVTISFV